MKKKKYFAYGYAFPILFFNGFLSFLIYYAAVGAHLVFSSLFLGLINLYLFVVFFARLCSERIVIEDDRIIISKAKFNPDCKGINKIRKKICFQFKDIKEMREESGKFLFLEIHYLTITLSTSRCYNFLLFGFSQRRVYKTAIKYFTMYINSNC